MLDGPRLIADALDARVRIEAALIATDVIERLAPLRARLEAAGVRIHEATPRVVQAASDVVTSQGIVALAHRPASAQTAVLAAADLRLLVADGIQDPGNLGTMIRTAAATAATAVAVTGAAADPWAPKALRASMGAAFRIPILRLEGRLLLEHLRAAGAAVYVADPRGALDYTRAALLPPLAIVVGNEAMGPDPAWLAAGTGVRIPLFGPVESLNAAVAAALLLYEATRRVASPSSHAVGAVHDGRVG
ncbi:MAG: RNA methyltransferase [Armatimonadota bacterium]|nr:RNA methyltransferase [Armatimonadota bacterium]